MKKILLFLPAVIFISTFSFSQVVIFEEGFESGNIPSEWTNIDNDGDAELWEMHPDSWSDPHSGSFSVASYSWYNGSPFTPDNWLITPQITLTEDCQLSYWISPISETYNQEHYLVCISTTDNTIESFTDILVDETIGETQTSWDEKTVDLSEYTGQDIYIAFAHTEITNIFAIKLDDILISTPTVNIEEDIKPEITVYPNPFSEFINIDLNFNSEVTISIYDMFGRKVLSNNKLNKDNFTLNTEVLAQGTYLLKIESEEYSKTFKITK